MDRESEIQYSPCDAETLIERLNDMKAQNADLRRKLLVLPTVRDDAIAGSRHDRQPCRACVLLQAQVERLSRDLECAADSHDRTTRSLNGKLEQALSDSAKERQRTNRMQAIIERQRAYINSVRFQSGPFQNQPGLRSWSDSESSSDDVLNDDGRPPVACEDDTLGLPPIEHGFLPSWRMDMDDISRQLQDLNDNVGRVEASTNRLSMTTKAVFSLSQRSTKPVAGGGVLGQAMTGLTNASNS